MEGREHRHDVYREGAVSYMSDNSDDFAPFIECNFRDYCHKMRQDGSWGGNLELQALSMAFEVNITIHQFDAPCLEIFNQFDTAVHLSYHDEEHYCSVRNIDDERNSPPTPIKLLQSNSSSGNSNSSDSQCNISKQEKIVMDSTGCRNIAIVREALEDNCDDVDASVEYLIGLRAIGEDTDWEISSHSQPTRASASSSKVNDEPVPTSRLSNKERRKLRDSEKTASASKSKSEVTNEKRTVQVIGI